MPARNDAPERRQNAVEHPAEPLMYTVPGACAAASHTRSRIYDLISSGDIEARKAGRRTLIVGASLRAYLDRLPRANIRIGRRAA